MAIANLFPFFCVCSTDGGKAGVTKKSTNAGKENVKSSDAGGTNKTKK